MESFDKNTIKLLEDSNKVVEINKAFHEVYRKMELVHQKLYTSFISRLPIKSSGKVSKGQNYQGLPYIVSDLPNHFKKDDAFSFRTMFWWGNEFSFTIMLSGKSLEKYLDIILNLSLPHYYCVNDTMWEYHFNDNNYTEADKLSIKDKKAHMAKNGFVKVAQKIALSDVAILESRSTDFYKTFLDEL